MSLQTAKAKSSRITSKIARSNPHRSKVASKLSLVGRIVVIDGVSFKLPRHGDPHETGSDVVFAKITNAACKLAEKHSDLESKEAILALVDRINQRYDSGAPGRKPLLPEDSVQRMKDFKSRKDALVAAIRKG
jgi:hypothetical protein